MEESIRRTQILHHLYPPTFNYNDYQNAWYRAFLYYPDIHSWFFNFHDSSPNSFPIWFYHWWMWFGCIPNALSPEAKEGWEYLVKTTTIKEPYMKEVQFFRQFNIAWIFCWEYRFHQYFQAPIPLSLVRIYKIKWWNEFKTKLCGKENVEHFCKTNTKKFTLHNLHLFRKQVQIEPSTQTKKESSSSSTKTKAKGLSQKERDLL